MSFAPERSEGLAWGFNTSVTCHGCLPVCVCFWCHHWCAQRPRVTKNDFRFILFFRFSLKVSRNISLAHQSQIPAMATCTFPSSSAPSPRAVLVLRLLPHGPETTNEESGWANWAVPHCPLSSVILQERDLPHLQGDMGRSSSSHFPWERSFISHTGGISI